MKVIELIVFSQNNKTLWIENGEHIYDKGTANRIDFYQYQLKKAYDKIPKGEIKTLSDSQKFVEELFKQTGNNPK